MANEKTRRSSKSADHKSANKSFAHQPTKVFEPKSEMQQTSEQDKQLNSLF